MTDQNKCPKCNSKNIESVGVGHSNTIAGPANVTLPVVDKWQYTCLDCGERFHIRKNLK